MYQRVKGIEKRMKKKKKKTIKLSVSHFMVNEVIVVTMKYCYDYLLFMVR
jgi:hypothetical protein